MLHLSRPEYLRDLCARSRLEFALAAIVIAEELALGVPHGIALGVTLSLLMLIYRTSHLQGAVLGQLPGTEAYRDVRRHPEAITFPGVLILAHWRRPVFRKRRPPRRGAEGRAGGRLALRRSMFFWTPIR
jgi:MFS superfamily sulfate permease-like transporter